MTIRMGQYGVGHGHADGKLQAMNLNRDIEVAGVFEPDPVKRQRAQRSATYKDVRWFRSAEEMLGDSTIQAIAVEGRNDESLQMAIEAAGAGKHLWYDKPAGDDWPQYLELIRIVRERKLHLQMGYMLRYSAAFEQITSWARSGYLGQVFSIRAHMSNWIPVRTDSNSGFTREHVGIHKGGMLYDLGGHMLDQICWILGRPTRVTSFLRNDATPDLPDMADNTLGVFEYEKAFAMLDIAAMEPAPPARRFEVYGTEASAIIPEPFEPGERIRLCLLHAKGAQKKGVHVVPVTGNDRDELYVREAVAFVATLRGAKPPDRPLEHEIVVQESLLRATGGIAGG